MTGRKSSLLLHLHLSESSLIMGFFIAPFSLA